MALPSSDLLSLECEQAVMLAAMENRIRQSMLEVIRPTIHRSANLESSVSEVGAQCEALNERLTEALEAQSKWQDKLDSVDEAKLSLGRCIETAERNDRRICSIEDETVKTLRKAQQTCEQQSNSAERLARNVDRAMQELESQRGAVKSSEAGIMRDVARLRETFEADLRQVNGDIKDLRESHQQHVAEVWGNEDEALSERSPLCLRRLDVQLGRLYQDSQVHSGEIIELRRTNTDQQVTQEGQLQLEARMKDVDASILQIDVRLNEVVAEMKADLAHATNMTTACTSSVMKEARNQLKEEMQSTVELRKDMGESLQKMQQSMVELSDHVSTGTAQAEATMREVRIDMENVEANTRKHKIAVEEELRFVKGRAQASLTSCEALVGGLNHVSGVIAMVLRGEKMAAALDLQDFADRTNTSYVGFVDDQRDTRKLGGGASRPVRMNEGLMQLEYKPKPVRFEDESVERARMLALREKLFLAAQEELTRGPKGDRVGRPAAAPLLPVSATTPLQPVVRAGSAARQSSSSARGRRPSPRPVSQSPEELAPGSIQRAASSASSSSMVYYDDLESVTNVRLPILPGGRSSKGCAPGSRNGSLASNADTCAPSEASGLDSWMPTPGPSRLSN